jgi:hypothetical protein
MKTIIWICTPEMSGAINFFDRSPLTEDEFLDKVLFRIYVAVWFCSFVFCVHDLEKVWKSCFEVEDIGISIAYAQTVPIYNPGSCTDVGGRRRPLRHVLEGCSFYGYKRKWNVRTKVLSACPCVNALLKV